MSDTQHSAGVQQTVLTDIDISFGRLIMIFIKFGLAAIPAAIVVSIIFMVIALIFTAVFGQSFFFMMGRPGGGPGI